MLPNLPDNVITCRLGLQVLNKDKGSYPLTEQTTDNTSIYMLYIQIYALLGITPPGDHVDWQMSNPAAAQHVLSMTDQESLTVKQWGCIKYTGTDVS